MSTLQLTTLAMGGLAVAMMLASLALIAWEWVWGSLSNLGESLIYLTALLGAVAFALTGVLGLSAALRGAS